MSDKTCCVPDCPLTSGLHRFPNPVKDKQRFDTWVKSIGGNILSLSDSIIYKYRRICNAHFEREFWCRNKRISKAAVPTLLLPGLLEQDTFTLSELEQEDQIETEEGDNDLSLYYDDRSSTPKLDNVNEDENSLLHLGCHCMVCYCEIKGFRYTCVQCSDLDLCRACELDGAHAQHYMLRVPKPKPYAEIQLVLEMIRQHLVKKLDPVTDTDHEPDFAVSVKVEVKSEFENNEPRNRRTVENLEDFDVSDEDEPQIIEPVESTADVNINERENKTLNESDSLAETVPSTAKEKSSVTLGDLMKIQEAPQDTNILESEDSNKLNDEAISVNSVPNVNAGNNVNQSINFGKKKKITNTAKRKKILLPYINTKKMQDPNTRKQDTNIPNIKPITKHNTVTTCNDVAKTVNRTESTPTHAYKKLIIPLTDIMKDISKLNVRCYIPKKASSTDTNIKRQGSNTSHNKHTPVRNIHAVPTIRSDVASVSTGDDASVNSCDVTLASTRDVTPLNGSDVTLPKTSDVTSVSSNDVASVINRTESIPSTTKRKLVVSLTDISKIQDCAPAKKKAASMTLKNTNVIKKVCLDNTGIIHSTPFEVIIPNLPEKAVNGRETMSKKYPLRVCQKIPEPRQQMMSSHSSFSM